jgi:hypothetical protein
MHVTQAVPFTARQLSEMQAIKFHGMAASPSPMCSAPLWQASTQAAQKLQAPWEKSVKGNLRGASLRMLSGHALTQSPQPSQAARNAGSGSAQGGRTGAFFPRQSPRRNWPRDIVLMCMDYSPGKLASFVRSINRRVVNRFDLYQFDAS